MSGPHGTPIGTCDCELRFILINAHVAHASKGFIILHLPGLEQLHISAILILSSEKAKASAHLPARPGIVTLLLGVSDLPALQDLPSGTKDLDTHGQ